MKTKNFLSKMSFRGRSAKVRLSIPRLRSLLPIILLFFIQASESKAQGVNFWSEQERISESIKLTEEPTHLLVDVNYTNHLFNPQPSHLNNDTLQTSSQYWLEPVILFEVDGEREIQDPVVLSDPYGNVHVFWLVRGGTEDEFNTIYYTRLDAIGWTSPVDVIAAEGILGINAAISQDDFIYLVWRGTGDIISYSRAPIKMAQSVKDWSKPTPITEATQYTSIVTSNSGDIYLAYGGKGNPGLGVFVQVLDPINLGWSSPRLISPISLINTRPENVQMRESNNGTLHVVWTEYYLPDYWPPRGVFYARSIDRGVSWSTPVLLAGDGYDQINIAVLDDENIHVAWNGMAGVGGRYHLWSSDGGLTWSDINEVIRAGLGGTEGPPEIIGDQSGITHILATYDSCVWYSYFESERWATPVCISGEKARASNYVEESALAISEGNKLHAVFWDDRKRLWYTTKVTEADWIPPKTLDNELIQPTQSQLPAESPIVTPTVNSKSLLSDQNLTTPPNFIIGPGQALIFSLLPVIFLIFLIIASRFYKKTK